MNFEYIEEWIIVYDGTKIKDNPKLFENQDNKIKEYVHNSEGISGNPQRNYALTKITNPDTLLYYLDDDHILDPNLYKLLDNIDKYYDSNTGELEELYYMSEINVDNFAKYHYSILISELPQIFKDASCIKLKLSNIDILLGLDAENDDVIYQPLFYILKDELRTWLELIYYTNKSESFRSNF